MFEMLLWECEKWESIKKMGDYVWINSMSEWILYVRGLYTHLSLQLPPILNTTKSYEQSFLAG